MTARNSATRELRSFRPAGGARHAGWSVAALLAPVTAAVFAGAVSWSATHDPVLVDSKTPETGPTATPPSAASPDATLTRQLRLEQRRVLVLRRQAARLKKKLAAYEGAGAATTGTAGTTGTGTGTSGSSSAGSTSKSSTSSGSSGSGSSGSGSAGSGSGGSGSGGSTAPAPSAPASTAPAAPPTSTSTGAS